MLPGQNEFLLLIIYEPANDQQPQTDFGEI